MRLDSIRVSRRHARINSQDGQYMLECLSATSGVVVNGQPLRGAYTLMPPGSDLPGDYLLMFALGFLYRKDEAVGQGGAVRLHGSHVWCNGQDLFLRHGAIKSQIGFVPQKDIMRKGITLGSMLNCAARLRLQDNVSPAERQARVSQFKRASIAIEMLSDPELFFLDEPTSGLDPGTERHLMQTLRKLTRKGKTVMLITQSTQVLPLRDKVAIMGNDGRLCYDGAPEESKGFFGIPPPARVCWSPP